MTLYQLDAEKLRPGDVIVEAGDGMISKLIKFFDSGRFSHVSVYVGMNALMEADEGVRIILASRVITETPDKFTVLRHPSHPHGLVGAGWTELANNLMFCALHPEANKPYSWLGVLATKLPLLKGKENSFFCSQLVCEGYRRVGVPLFQPKRSPEKTTPNMFVSDECLLRPVQGCFSALPDKNWIAGFAKSRYDVMKSEPIPLAQVTHERVRELVETFGPRVDTLTQGINKKQTIASPSDLYLTLTYPDLPEADAVSDDVVAFMKLRFPAQETAMFRELSKAAFMAGVAMNDPDVTALIKRTLRKDIAAVEGMLPMIAAQAQMFRSFPPPPLRRRSIHDWLEKQLKDSLAVETDLLNWRKNLLQRLSGSSASET